VLASRSVSDGRRIVDDLPNRVLVQPLTMRSAVALVLVLTVSTVGCFPKDAHKRTLAQLGEGGALAAGVLLEAFLGSGAECDQMTKIGSPPDANCHQRSTIYGDVGVALILGGLLGFVATISTAEDEKEPPKIDIKAADAPKPEVKLPPGVTAQPKPQEVAAPTDPTPTPAAGSNATPAP
jgi:hypothetical protein